MLKWYGPSLAYTSLLGLRRIDRSLAFFWMRRYTTLHGAGGAVVVSILRQIYISDEPACQWRDRVQAQILPVLHRRTLPRYLSHRHFLLHISYPSLASFVRLHILPSTQVLVLTRY